MKRNFVLLLAVLVTAILAIETALAAVPMLISHQGRLLDAFNQPVTGTRNLTFKIFETPTGGSPLWTETHLGVPIANGLFNVILGSTIAISGDLVVTTGTLETERYLAIQVEGDVAELSPRRRLTSSAYAVAASRVSGDVVTSPGQVALSGMSGSTTATIRASQDPVNPGSELFLVDGNGSTTATIRAIQPLGGNLTIHSSLNGSTTGTIRMQASGDSALFGSVLDLDGDDIPDVGTTSAAKVSRNILKSFFQTGDFPTQAQFSTQNGLASVDVSTFEADQEHSASISADSTGSELKFKNGPIGGGMSGSTTGTIRVGAPSSGGGGGGAGGDAFTVRGTFSDGTTHDVTCDMSANIIESALNLIDDRYLLGLRSYSASVDSAGSQVLLSADDNGDGVMEHTVWQKVDNSNASMLTSSRFGSGPRQTTSQDGSFAHARMQCLTDMESDGIPDVGISSTSSADSAGLQGFFERGDKPTQSQFSTLIDSYGARSSLSGRSGSTTGTIRMMASPDSADHEVSFDNTPSGVSSKVKEKANRTKCSANLQHIRTTGSSGVEETCDSTGASLRAINTKGTGSNFRTSMSANDSAGVTCESDADGDGHQERNVGIYVSEVSGQSKMECLADTDDDGVADMSAETVVDATSASSRWKGMSGSTTGTIRMKATPDSAVFVLGYSGSTTGTIRLQASSSGTANPIEHSSGAHLTVGGDWTNASDKNLKENFSEVDGEKLLAKIDELSIKQWNYKSEGESVTHIGPTAQDFKDVFGVGSDNKTISTIDPSGIALAAIKELNRQNQELAKQNAELLKELKDLKKKVNDLASRR